jgi:hypothetical protein
MRPIVIAAIVTAGSIGFAAGALTPTARADMRPLLRSLGIGIISCSRSTPCQEGNNAGTGPGLEGLSAKGKGLVGSSNQADGIDGLSGAASGLTPNIPAAVAGDSSNGDGLRGFSKNASGLYAKSTNGLGLLALSDKADAVVALSGALNGVNGATLNPSKTSGHSFSGVFGHDNSNDGGQLNFGVAGTSSSGIGVLGFSSSFVGVNAVGGGFASSDRFPALSVAGNGSGYTDLIDGCATRNPCDNRFAVFNVDNSGDVNGNVIVARDFVNARNGVTTLGSIDVGFGAFPARGDINISGQYQKNFMCVVGCTSPTLTAPGRAVVGYAATVSQPTIEDFGEAQLADGLSYVRLGADFANVVDERADYSVFITPEGNSRGLYVTEKTRVGFTVRENEGGRSTLAFSYRIVARPFDSHEPRLPMVALRKLPREQFAPGLRR